MKPIAYTLTMNFPFFYLRSKPSYITLTFNNRVIIIRPLVKILQGGPETKFLFNKISG